MSTTITVRADPAAITLETARSALMLIDMQRDFIEPGGFGATLGNDVALLARTIAPCKAMLQAARRAGLLVIHTCEGHRADLSDAPKTKLERGTPSLRIGDHGPWVAS
jgi:biuret amidohydrolase